MDYLNEQQQVEQLKAWWKEYGLALVAGIVIAVLIVLFWHYYQRYEMTKTQQASLIYTTMINSDLSQQEQSAIDAANSIIKQYPRTSYAALAALWLAKDALQKQDYPSAEHQLQWVTDHAKMNSLRQVARLRLAYIALQQQQPKIALQILNKVDDKAYLGLVSEIQGDAYLAMNNVDQARQYYQKAMQELPDPTLTQPLLAMKLADLPVAGK